MYKVFYLLVLSLKLSLCQRRVTDGSRVGDDVDTGFMVYIVGAKQSNHVTGWLCGGSIIHPSLILTSGSCLIEKSVKNKYVIAGYRKYVSTENLDKDPCTKHMKKRIVSYCTHKRWNTGEGNTKWPQSPKYVWTKYDIGVARTDTPLDFFDGDYLRYCSYLPKSININFNTKYEEPPLDLVIYGWGHAKYYRPHGDVNDYNEKYLLYTSTVMQEQKVCQKPYKSNSYMFNRFEYNSICTSGKGNLDASGRRVAISKPVNSKCSNANKRRAGEKSEMDCRNCTASVQDNHSNEIILTGASHNTTIGITRRHGLCQNDHGNPLIHWIGGIPHVIGIASAFVVNQQMECMDFSLHARLTCPTTKQFLKCKLENMQANDQGRRSGSHCDKSDHIHTREHFFDWSDEE